MRLIKIIGPSLERRRHLKKILVEQAVNLTGGPVVGHLICDDPRNKVTFIAIGFAKQAWTYEELDKLYRGTNNIDKSLLNIDFKFNLEHVTLAVNLWLAHYNAGKYDEYPRLMNHLLYLTDCLLFVDNAPQNIKSLNDLYVLEFKKVIALAPLLVKEIGSAKSKRMLEIQHDGEYMVARADLFALDYLLDDRSLAEVYSAFTAAQQKPLPAPQVPAYASPLKAISIEPVKKQLPVTIVKQVPTEVPAPVKRSYAQIITQRAKPKDKQNSAVPLTWLRNSKEPGYKNPEAYKIFNTKRKSHKSAGEHAQQATDFNPEKHKAGGKRLINRG